MMFALWMAVTFLRRWRRAYAKANSEIRVDALAVMIFKLSTPPGTTVCSRPAYRSSVFSRTMTRSTPWNRASMPGRFHTGRKFAYRSSAFRSPTLTLENPSAIGVATGPLRATLFRRIESINSGGRVCPDRSKAGAPAKWRSQSICTPDAPRIRTTASVTSGPMPSPGISVIVCAICFIIIVRLPLPGLGELDEIVARVLRSVHEHEPDPTELTFLLRHYRASDREDIGDAVGE